MTLGGLALAVGILVDEATVTIENINWHLEQGKEVEQAILDGAEQIVTPASRSRIVTRRLAFRKDFLVIGNFGWRPGHSRSDWSGSPAIRGRIR